MIADELKEKAKHSKIKSDEFYFKEPKEIKRREKEQQAISVLYVLMTGLFILMNIQTLIICGFVLIIMSFNKTLYLRLRQHQNIQYKELQYKLNEIQKDLKIIKLESNQKYDWRG